MARTWLARSTHAAPFQRRCCRLVKQAPPCHGRCLIRNYQRLGLIRHLKGCRPGLGRARKLGRRAGTAGMPPTRLTPALPLCASPTSYNMGAWLMVLLVLLGGTGSSGKQPVRGPGNTPTPAPPGRAGAVCIQIYVRSPALRCPAGAAVSQEVACAGGGAVGSRAGAGRALLARPSAIALPVAGAPPSAPGAAPSPEAKAPVAEPAPPPAAEVVPTSPAPPPAPEAVRPVVSAALPAPESPRPAALPAPAPSAEAPPQNVSATGGGGLTGGSCPDRQAVLDAHNAERAQHGAAPLTWSADLADKAQAEAAKCQLQARRWPAPVWHRLAWAWALHCGSLPACTFRATGLACLLANSRERPGLRLPPLLHLPACCSPLARATARTWQQAQRTAPARLQCRCGLAGDPRTQLALPARPPRAPSAGRRWCGRWVHIGAAAL